MDHKEQAMVYFQTGCNCCQAVVCAYCQEMGLDEEEACELAAGYGGGHYQGLCGALLGSYIVTNYLKGTPEKDDPAKCKNDAAGKLLVEEARNFEQECGSLYCGTLFGERPCSDYICTTTEILDKNLTE